MEEGPPVFRQDFSCPALLSESSAMSAFVYGAFTLCRRTFQTVPLTHITDYDSGLLPFRSPLLRESRLISFPRGTEMFQFPRFASRYYVFIT